MKTRIAILLVMLMGMALLFGCATTEKMEVGNVRTNIAFWEECGWADMTEAEQALWGKLGWNEDSWEGEAKQPASEDKNWNQLTGDERAAAKALGYTKATWDEE